MIKNKNKKKIIYSLLAATLISSSAASAASYNYANVRYKQVYNNYRYNVVAQSPTFTWTVVNTSRRPVYTQPTQPVVKKDNWTPSYPTTPSVPAPKPVEPAVPTESVSGISSIEMEVVRLVNIERQKEGLAPLVASSALSNVARKKSEDMAVNNYFSHTSPTYGSSSNMMRTFGINSSYSGENIAKGQLSAASVVSGWMNSSGHRANIMNPSFKTIGVGHFKSSNGTNLWTQMFTN